MAYVSAGTPLHKRPQMSVHFCSATLLACVLCRNRRRRRLRPATRTLTASCRRAATRPTAACGSGPGASGPQRSGTLLSAPVGAQTFGCQSVRTREIALLSHLAFPYGLTPGIAFPTSCGAGRRLSSGHMCPLHVLLGHQEGRPRLCHVSSKCGPLDLRSMLHNAMVFCSSWSRGCIRPFDQR